MPPSGLEKARFPLVHFHMLTVRYTFFGGTMVAQKRLQKILGSSRFSLTPDILDINGAEGQN